MKELMLLAIHPHASPDHVGAIADWLNLDDPRPAKEQLNAGYQHGGGWWPIDGFKMIDACVLKYPGDPPFPPMIAIPFRDELVLIYEHALVCILQKDETFEVARMD